ncbi:MAG: penicillin-binding transpeptidase domain-containing protein, partial [Candidatus Methanoperedens sp.]|nr:penicillin-binding transpeptidase domain-containing protein [Candidatus Methanoperedens sp.]
MSIIKYLKYNKSNNGENNTDPFVIQEGKMKLGKIKTSYRLDWTEEALALRGGDKETIGKNFNFSNLSKIGAILAFFLLIIFTRAAWLQIVKGEYYYGLAEGNRIRIERVEAKRGVIYDSKFRPLVRNTANFLLYFMPVDLPDNENERDRIIKRVSEILSDISADEIKQILTKVKQGSLESYQPLFIADNIEYEKAMLLYLGSANMPGVILSNKTRREYNLREDPEHPESRMLGISALSHILGYTGKIGESELAEFGSEYSPIDYIGKMGIEYFWENELKGHDGRKQIEVDALGKEKKIINQEPTKDGHNLVLSVDGELQRKLEETLSGALQKLKLKKGAAIIMNPNNGEILAMVSLPAYNNNIFARGATNEEYQGLAGDPDHPLFNRCVSGEYPSGSTIKPVIAAAALEEGTINEHTSFNSVGGIRIGEWFFPDWRAGGHGVTDVRRALAESINTFFYYIGGGYQDFKGLGIERIVQYGKLFGLS